MSILTDIESYLSSRPDEELFELMYVLGQFNLVVQEWGKYGDFDEEEEFEIVDETLNDLYKNTEWFQLKEGRYEKFLEYVHEHMLAYYNSIRSSQIEEDNENAKKS